MCWKSRHDGTSTIARLEVETNSTWCANDWLQPVTLAKLWHCLSWQTRQMGNSRSYLPQTSILRKSNTLLEHAAYCVTTKWEGKAARNCKRTQTPQARGKQIKNLYDQTAAMYKVEIGGKREKSMTDSERRKGGNAGEYKQLHCCSQVIRRLLDSGPTLMMHPGSHRKSNPVHSVHMPLYFSSAYRKSCRKGSFQDIFEIRVVLLMAMSQLFPS